MSAFAKNVARVLGVVLMPFMASCGTASVGADAGRDASADITADTGPAILTAPTETTYTTSAGPVHMPCQGAGPRAVVLLAGGADPVTTWDGLVTALGPNVLTCRFNRPGVSPSYVPKVPLTPQLVSDALAETLTQAKIGARFVLVGHSLGGLAVRVYGSQHASAVAGALFLDATVPDFCTTPNGRPELMGFSFDPDATKAQGNAVTSWGSSALVKVLSHDGQLAVSSMAWTAPDQQAWDAGQKVYAALTPRGTQADVPNANHYVYRSAPDVVTAEIKKLLEEP